METEATFNNLNELLLEAQVVLPEAEFGALRRGIGMAIGYLYTDVESPIHSVHPELVPEGLRRDKDLDT